MIFNANNGDIGCFAQDGTTEQGREDIRRLIKNVQAVLAEKGVDFQGGETPDRIADRVESHVGGEGEHAHLHPTLHADGHYH
jgi:hypothetical protein